ncbi:MAG: prolyl oligopeptidase family serine peptidase [Pseudomonadota bacterium]|nr:prolyl oligopeptidase family serine peptidase [Pseudomonadota bacterium]
MLSRTTHVAFALLALAGAVPTGYAQAPAASSTSTAVARPPVEAFFEHPSFRGAALSPNGRYLTALSGAKDKRDFLVVIDLRTMKPTVVAAYNDSDVDQFRWVNNDRLVYQVADNTVGQGDTRYYPGLFAVDKDGGRPIQLVDRYVTPASRAESIGRTLLRGNHFLHNQLGPQDSDNVYVTNPVFVKGELLYSNLLRVNTVTGQSVAMPRPYEIKRWVMDSKGEPRLGYTSGKGMTTVYYRDVATNAWRTLATYNTYTDNVNPITPVAFDNSGVLYVEAHGGKDTKSLYTFNFATNKINPEPLVVTTGYDFDGNLVQNRDKVLGVAVSTDARANEWFVPEMKVLQDKVDKILPVTVNLLMPPADPTAENMLVRSYSDVVPTMYSVYNIRTGAVSKIGSTRQSIDPARMGPQKAITYQARDGLSITALLTLPRAGTRKNLPMVVLVHGGPWVRGATWGWHPMSQFLASRGYAVLEPEFRGATGYGQKLYKAGWKQWGLGMQNDVADATRWAIAQGYADGKRICIAGASYGGYATLMGLVNDPDLYKCGVDWVGVTDINLMFNDDWTARSDLADDYKEHGMPFLVGDQIKDAQQLRATSPIAQAARITQPLLLAYGGSDDRVPIFHGRKFYDAVKATNKNVEWIEYPGEGHGWYLPKNNYDFWTRVEKFLDKNIGTAQ